MHDNGFAESRGTITFIYTAGVSANDLLAMKSTVRHIAGIPIQD